MSDPTVEIEINDLHADPEDRPAVITLEPGESQTIGRGTLSVEVTALE